MNDTVSTPSAARIFGMNNSSGGGRKLSAAKFVPGGCVISPKMVTLSPILDRDPRVGKRTAKRLRQGDDGEKGDPRATPGDATREAREPQGGQRLRVSRGMRTPPPSQSALPECPELWAGRAELSAAPALGGNPPRRWRRIKGAPTLPGHPYPTRKTGPSSHLHLKEMWCRGLPPPQDKL